MIAGLSVGNIALIGFMATGKTSVGRRLSRCTGLPFRDIDEIIETTEGMTIPEIFASRGEAYFRERESTLIRELCAGVGQIIGCGGGTLINPQNVVILHSRCFAVWLRASVTEIVRRVEMPGAPSRPLLRGGDPEAMVSRILRDREPLYRGADLVIDTDGKTIEEIAERIRLELALPLREQP